MVETFLNFVPVIVGLGALFIGCGAIIFPEFSSGQFGIKVKGEGAPYVRAMGARDIFIGLVFLLLFCRDDRKSLALVCFFTGIVSVADFVITQIYGSKKNSLGHLIATVLVVAYGFWVFKS